MKYSSLVQPTFKKYSSLIQKKCNSASSFSGSVNRDKSKCLIAFPTNTKQAKLFERILISGFGCVNTRLAFYSQI